MNRSSLYITTGRLYTSLLYVILYQTFTKNFKINLTVFIIIYLTNLPNKIRNLKTSGIFFDNNKKCLSLLKTFHKRESVDQSYSHVFLDSILRAHLFYQLLKRNLFYVTTTVYD